MNCYKDGKLDFEQKGVLHLILWSTTRGPGGMLSLKMFDFKSSKKTGSVFEINERGAKKIKNFRLLSSLSNPAL